MKKINLLCFVVIVTSQVSAQWNTSGSNVYTSSGNVVGIGINTPQAPLHVSGPGSGSANELNVLVQNSLTGGARTFLTAFVGKSSVQTDKDFTIRTNGGGWSDKVIITNAGNVGIGSPSNPTVKFEVYGQDANFYSGTATNTINFGRLYGEHYSLKATDLHGYFDYVQDDDGNDSHIMYFRNLAAGTSASNDIRFQTGGSDRITVKSNGNVGIGTTSPSGVLSIEQTLANSSAAHLLFGDPTATAGTASSKLIFSGSGIQHAGFAWIPTYPTDQGKLNLTFGASGNPNANAAKVTFQSNGNVGIGTTSPNHMLTIQGTPINSSYGHLLLGDPTAVSGTASSKLTFSGSGIQHAGFAWIPRYPSDKGTLNLTFGSSGNPDVNAAKVTFQSGGNVGIGVPDPKNLLDVNGAARFRRSGSATDGVIIDGEALTLQGWAANNPYIEWRNADNSRQGYMGWNTNRLSLMLENGYNFTVEQGNVGIGCTNPDSKLTVAGTIHAEEVKVEILSATVCPDYVFEPDYNLTKLELLEAYIKENKHLPEVPSAKQMEEEGLNLKEMNLLLLKKVEELTLHLIAQEKNNKEQQQRIAILEQQMKMIKQN
jgi:hypothetical protein